jgi:predicted AAA+ superfamily ATPase
MITRLISLPRRSFFLLGPRLTGKSTWIKSKLPDALHLDLLEEANFQKYLSSPVALEQELLAFQKKRPTGWVVIDEIQRIPSLLNGVHAFLEKSSLKFALSGSSARKLKRGGANLLGGRATEMHFFPLTCIEIGKSFELASALRWGGLPAVYLAEPTEKKQILRAYVSTYLREEIQTEGITRNLPAFTRFLQLAAETVGQEVNYSSISRDTGVMSKTIAEYYQVLEDTLLGTLLPPWKKTVRKQLAGSPKFYFFDNGVTNALRENLNDAPPAEARGVLFEQWVIQEVRALLAYREFEGSCYFWRARGGNEVDLIIARGSKPVLAIEIKSTKNPGLKDLAGIRSFQEEYPKTPVVLITQAVRASMLGEVEAIPAVEFMQRLWNGEFKV